MEKVSSEGGGREDRGLLGAITSPVEMLGREHCLGQGVKTWEI